MGKSPTGDKTEYRPPTLKGMGNRGREYSLAMVFKKFSFGSVVTMTRSFSSFGEMVFFNFSKIIKKILKVSRVDPDFEITLMAVFFKSMVSRRWFKVSGFGFSKK